MQARLFRREVLPFLGGISALVGIALLLDALLHLLNAVWIGRYLGIPGTLMIIGSTVYSLRKRKLIRAGQPAPPCVGMNVWPGRGHCWCSCMPASISTRSSPGSQSPRCC